MAPSKLRGPTEVDEPSDEFLYNPTLLAELKLSDQTGVQFDPPITILAPADGLITRPLKRLDYTRGFLKILSQLTVVGDVSEEQFLETFATMKDRPGTYYVTVIEDQNSGEVVGAATLLIEQKFVHHCARRARIEDVVVSDAYRSKQLGKLLIATLTLLGKHLDSYKITLDCNDRMAPFYQSLGFIMEPGNSNTLAIRY